jgi:hypothetical protein
MEKAETNVGVPRAVSRFETISMKIRLYYWTRDLPTFQGATNLNEQQIGRYCLLTSRVGETIWFGYFDPDTWVVASRSFAF